MRWPPVPCNQMMDGEARAVGVAEASGEDPGEKYSSRVTQKQERLGGGE